MEQFIEAGTISSLVGQVPALAVVALLAWFVFNRTDKSIDRLANVIEAMRRVLEENTAGMGRNIESANRSTDSANRAMDERGRRP